MDQTDPAIRRADRSLRHFVLNVRGPEHGLLQIIREVEFVQPLHDSPLACPTATRHNSVHSKSSVKLVFSLLDTNETPQNAEGFRVFLFSRRAERIALRLIRA